VANLVANVQRSEEEFEFDVEGLGAILEKAYIGEPTARSMNAWRRKSFPPSGVGYGSGRCARRWYYEFKHDLVRIDDKGALEVANMNYGTEAHERIQKVFEDSGILIEAERALNTIGKKGLPPVKGFVDLIVNWNGEAVGEIKTTKQEAFTLLKAAGKPRGYQLIQLLIYMKILKINRGFILYENKNTGEFLIFPVIMEGENQRIADNAFEWLIEVSENDELPTRPFTKSEMACKTCPLSAHCWSDEEGTEDIPLLEVPE